MPNITPPHHKLTVTFRLDQDSIETDMAEAALLANQGISVIIIIPPGIRFEKQLTLVNNMTIQGELENILPLKINDQRSES